MRSDHDYHPPDLPLYSAIRLIFQYETQVRIYLPHPHSPLF